VRGTFEHRFQHLQNALDIAEHIIVPNPDRPVPEIAHRRFTLGIRCVVGMLAAIDLDNDAPLTTDKVPK